MSNRTCISALLIVALLSGCATDHQTDSGPTGINRVPVRALSDDANLLRSQAIAGVHRRGEQDEMLRLEAQLPGFGGFFLDSLSEVVVYMKPTDQAEVAPSATSVRALLSSRYASRATPVRELMAPATRAQIRVGQYTLSELIAIENRISTSPVRIAGFSGVGTSLFLNRVKVGFRNAADMSEGLPVIASLGVPRAAILPEVWGETVTTGTWKDRYRPTRGGLKISTCDLSAPVCGSVIGSHGFNVRRVATGTDHFLTASHLLAGQFGATGRTGDLCYQATVPNGVIGVVIVNPPWPIGALGGCPGYDFCTDSDVLLASFTAGVSGERKIGTSQYEGNNGQVGSQHINNWYPVEGVVAPEFIQLNHNIVHKSGQTTGTTTGGIDLPCAQLPSFVPWPGSPAKTLYHWCVARVAFAGWGGGDSGGSVFARKVSGGPYWALGIQVAGGPAGQGVCTAGQLCAFYFTSWTSIEATLNVGMLNPRTVQ